MTNKQLVQKYFEEVYNKGNIAFTEQCFLPTVLFHDVIPVQPGIEGVKQLVQLYREAFPDLHIQIEDIIEQDDKLAVRWKVTGTHKAMLFGIAPTRKFASVTGLSLYRFQKDKIVEAWVHWDVLAMLRELNVELPINLELEVTA